MVAGGTKGAGPVVASQPLPGAAGASHTRVGCGQARGDLRVTIADPEIRTACTPGQEGEVWVAGPSVGQGYWDRPDESEQTFRAHLADGCGPFLRTGDLGFLQDGHLFVTGRLKDLIIIGGRNHYPHDIEQTIERSHPAIRPNGCAAFAVEAGQQERLVVMAEVDPRCSARTPPGGGGADPVAALVRAVRRAVSEHHDVTPHRVVLVRPLTIPRTSSGKIQRHACRAGFLARSFPTLYE
jgi:acyl-CoA synthetase (AMP-forming)/AMP-acid ligase II